MPKLRWWLVVSLLIPWGTVKAERVMNARIEAFCNFPIYYAGTTYRRPAGMDGATAKFWHDTVEGLVEHLRDLTDPRLRREEREHLQLEVQEYLDRLALIKLTMERARRPIPLPTDRSFMQR
jgi:hypothetical protein